MCFRKTSIALWLLGVLFYGCCATTNPPNKPLINNDAKNEIDILFFNIRGLPGFISLDCPRTRIHTIAKYIPNYDAVFFQEDYAHYDLLQDPARTIIRGNDSRFRFLKHILNIACGRCGSGLTATLSKNILLEAHGNASFGNTCSGRVFGGGDCFSTKGLLWVKIRLKNGASLMIYTTHLDSGKGENDQEAREAQLKILENHILKNTKPTDTLIVGGDFNAKIDELQDFLATLKLRPAFADTLRNKKDKKHIDHIFYRNGDASQIEILASGDVSDMPKLSDHRPIFIRIKVSAITSE